MATRKKGLGRGLDALLGADHGALDAVGARGAHDAPSHLPIKVLRAGRYQPRTRMDEGALNDLADSIRAQGVMQPDEIVLPLTFAGLWCLGYRLVLAFYLVLQRAFIASIASTGVKG